MGNQAKKWISLLKGDIRGSAVKNGLASSVNSHYCGCDFGGCDFDKLDIAHKAFHSFSSPETRRLPYGVWRFVTLLLKADAISADVCKGRLIRCKGNSRVVVVKANVG